MSHPLVSRTVTIKNEQGLHARPARMFATTASQFASEVELVKGNERVDAKSIIHIMTLGATRGTELLLEARGVDAEQAIAALVQLVDDGFANPETLSQEQAS